MNVVFVHFWRESVFHLPGHVVDVTGEVLLVCFLRDIETLSLCGLMWKRFRRVSQSLVHVIKRSRWRIKPMSLALSVLLLCSSCEPWVALVGGVSAKRPRGDWHSYAWSFTPRRFFFCLFFFFEFTQSSSSKGTPDDVDVSQTALLLFALFLRKYERPKRGAWARLGVSVSIACSATAGESLRLTSVPLQIWTTTLLRSKNSVYHHFELVFWSSVFLATEEAELRSTLVYVICFEIMQKSK